MMLVNKNNYMTRIIKRQNVDGRVEYVIQQKHFLFRWWWVDAWVNSMSGASCRDTFSSLEDATRSLCYFNGSKPIETVVTINNEQSVKESDTTKAD